MGRGGLSPTAEKIADIRIFGTQIGCGSLHHGTVDVMPKRCFFALGQQKVVDFSHRPDLSSVSSFLSNLAFLSKACRTDLCRACKEIIGSSY